jgi:hypothetical protein
MEGLEGRQMLTTWTVNTPIDEADGVADEEISLRDAITAATSSGDTINFDADEVNGETIALTLGQLEIEGKFLTIDASMLTNGITIDAGDTTTQVGDGIRIFKITDPTSGSAPPLVTLKGLTLKGGDPVRSCGNQEGNGGAIYSTSRLEIFNCTIEQNEAYTGGGIHIKVAGGSVTAQREILTIEDSVIQDNEARAGGGIDMDSGSNAIPTSDLFSITRTTISNNHALSTSPQSGGGGLFAQLYGAHLEVTDSTISGNTAASAATLSLIRDSRIHFLERSSDWTTRRIIPIRATFRRPMSWVRHC